MKGKIPIQGMPVFIHAKLKSTFIISGENTKQANIRAENCVLQVYIFSKKYSRRGLTKRGLTKEGGLINFLKIFNY